MGYTLKMEGTYVEMQTQIPPLQHMLTQQGQFRASLETEEDNTNNVEGRFGKKLRVCEWFDGNRGASTCDPLIFRKTPYYYAVSGECTKQDSVKLCQRCQRATRSSTAWFNSTIRLAVQLYDATWFHLRF